ncbi:RagB/SusD family nutrient uptake outer membrane protein [Chitinophaga qingshengii]|uniref:RagB/SusD family nutrient uptake outer membrane protein n=1 Tax=Chitinophaga qingshengii TaxID=1569794 RepID=A0ABR7TGB4_9BACT|nr:RagB/SusD family nutrient uptake outer membrane protein [Chitinophaga qingshengii]MBC9929465.1 RagB/SusD family nutrient uptake outer membrane protein [Chitinophaga qingshengii]
MRKLFYSIIGCTFFLAGMSGCNKFLDRQPLSAPATGTFLNNENEINVSLTAVYGSVKWEFGTVPYQSGTDGWTDIAILRANELGEGTFDTYNTHPQTIWKFAYTTIQRANTMLDGMVKAKPNVTPAIYSRMEAEARVLRAWAYFYLAFMFGDAPLITKPLQPSEFYNQLRTPKQDIVKFIYNELDEAAKSLDWAPSVRGRVSKSLALGLKARTALNNKDYAVAADAAKLVIDNAGLSLNPRFQDLFTRSGQKPNAGNEIMFEIFYTDALASSFTYLPLGNASRAAGGQSGRFPTQRLVDMFECTDGKRIDESTKYDPLHPSKNRDLRLKYTVSLPGDTLMMNNTTFVYDIYSDKTSFKNADGTWSVKGNADYDNAFGPNKSGVGYLWTKYTMTDENVFLSRVSFILMRYAEVLLTYAEAKIELGQLDGTVTAAINKVRQRAGQPPVATEIQGNQLEMRKLIRRERTVELAIEGFRWFDIRRWNVASLVMPGKVVGIALNPAAMPPVPNFKTTAETDLNSIPDYSGQLDLRKTRETRFWTDKLMLMPVPQSERDINRGLTQNTGW